MRILRRFSQRFAARIIEDQPQGLDSISACCPIEGYEPRSGTKLSETAGLRHRRDHAGFPRQRVLAGWISVENPRSSATWSATSFPVRPVPSSSGVDPLDEMILSAERRVPTGGVMGIAGGVGFALLASSPGSSVCPPSGGAITWLPRGFDVALPRHATVRTTCPTRDAPRWNGCASGQRRRRRSLRFSSGSAY